MTSKQMWMPVGHKVLVKPDEIEKVSGGGIVLVQDEKLAEFTQQVGTIVAIGPDAWKAFRQVDDNGKLVNGRPWAEVGDKVLYSKNAGKFIRHPDSNEKFLLMMDEDIGMKLITVKENVENV